MCVNFVFLCRLFTAQPDGCGFVMRDGGSHSSSCFAPLTNQNQIKENKYDNSIVKKKTLINTFWRTAALTNQNQIKENKYNNSIVKKKKTHTHSLITFWRNASFIYLVPRRERVRRIIPYHPYFPKGDGEAGEKGQRDEIV